MAAAVQMHQLLAYSRHPAAHCVCAAGTLPTLSVVVAVAAVAAAVVAVVVPAVVVAAHSMAYIPLVH